MLSDLTLVLSGPEAGVMHPPTNAHSAVQALKRNTADPNPIIDDNPHVFV